MHGLQAKIEDTIVLKVSKIVASQVGIVEDIQSFWPVLLVDMNKLVKKTDHMLCPFLIRISLATTVFSC